MLEAFFFAHRVVKPWNSLPMDVVDFSSLNRFRSSLHRIDFNPLNPCGGMITKPHVLVCS